MYNDHIPVRIIAIKEGISRHAVHGVIRRYKHQEEAQSKARPGRPRVITERDKSHILQVISRNPFITTRELIEQAGLSCHPSTLIRFLRKEGIQHYQALQRPLLSLGAVLKRRAFAERYYRENASFWHSWFFSDEASIARGEGRRRSWVFCPSVYSIPSYLIA